jgi:hypothetical protein
VADSLFDRLSPVAPSVEEAAISIKNCKLSLIGQPFFQASAASRCGKLNKISSSFRGGMAGDPPA